jgi:hypothetical protein
MRSGVNLIGRPLVLFAISTMAILESIPVLRSG